MHFDRDITAKDLWQGRKFFVQMAGGWPKVKKNYDQWDGGDRFKYFWSFFETEGRRLGAQSLYSGEKVTHLLFEDQHSIEHIIPRSEIQDILRSRRAPKELIDSAISNPFNLAPSNRKVNKRRASYPLDFDEDEVFVRHRDRYSHIHWTYGLDHEREWVVPPRSRGDVARAVIYMCLIYQLDGEYAKGMDDLLEWHRQDQPSKVEIAYNEWVYKELGIKNPLIG